VPRARYLPLGWQLQMFGVFMKTQWLVEEIRVEISPAFGKRLQQMSAERTDTRRVSWCMYQEIRALEHVHP
jgi:hypothetical protein